MWRSRVRLAAAAVAAAAVQAFAVGQAGATDYLVHSAAEISSATLGADPTVSITLSENAQWTWVQLGQYTIDATDVNRPFTLELGKRERSAEIDRLLFSPVALNLPAMLVPEPAEVGFIACAIPFLVRRRQGRTR